MRPSLGHQIIEKVEVVVIALLQLLLVVVVLAGTAQLFLLLYHRLPAIWGSVHDTEELHVVMQSAFGGVLIVVLGLELIETLKVYFREHRVRVEVILTVSLIAVSRHIIQVDYEQMTGAQLIGLGSIILALAGGYFLVARARAGDADEG
jgi:uncharacterized membrane protein (DUF373 family)